VTLKEVRSFLPRVNCKIATKKLGDVFQEVDTRHRQELGFDDFASLYYKLMFSDESVSLVDFLKYSVIYIISLGTCFVGYLPKLLYRWNYVFTRFHVLYGQGTKRYNGK